MSVEWRLGDGQFSFQLSVRRDVLREGRTPSVSSVKMRHRAWRFVILLQCVILSFNHGASAVDSVVNNAGNLTLSESDSALLTNIYRVEDKILLGAKDDSVASYSVISEDQFHQYSVLNDSEKSTLNLSDQEEVDGSISLKNEEDEGIFNNLIKFTRGTLLKMFYDYDSSKHDEKSDTQLEEERYSSVNTNNSSNVHNDVVQSESKEISNIKNENGGVSVGVLDKIYSNSNANSETSDEEVDSGRSRKDNNQGNEGVMNDLIAPLPIINSGIDDKTTSTGIKTHIFFYDRTLNDDPNAQYHLDEGLEDDDVWSKLIKGGREEVVPGSLDNASKEEIAEVEVTENPEFEDPEKMNEQTTSIEVKSETKDLGIEENVFHVESGKEAMKMEEKDEDESVLLSGSSTDKAEVEENQLHKNKSKNVVDSILETTDKSHALSTHLDQSNKSVELVLEVTSTPVSTVISVQEEDVAPKKSSESSTEIINSFTTIASTSGSKSTNSSEMRLLNDAPQDVVEQGSDQEALEKEDSGVSLAFVFDATGSMWDDLVQVREGAAKILNAMLERPDKPIYNYVLVPFQDPDIGPVTVTTDHAYLMQQLNAIQVFGGSDCPEMSIHAVKLALETSRPYSYIYVFTDASAKDHALVDEVLPLVQEKLSKVVFVMTGDCGNPKHPGYLVYHKIAATSSGQVYHLNKTDVNEVLNFIRLTLKPQKEKVNLLSVDHVGEINKNDSNIPLTVDKSLSEFTVSLSGRNASLGIVDPSGVPAVPPKLTPLLDLENVKVVNIKEPDPGIWTLQVDVDSDSQFTVRTTGLSSSDFGYGFSKQPTINPAYTVARPFKGSVTNLLVWTTDPDDLNDFKSVELTGINGKVYQILPLVPIEEYNGLYKTKPFTPPEDFFYIHVHGVTSDGHPFRRITPTAVSPAKEEKPEIVVNSIEVEVYANRNAVLSGFVKSYLPFKVDWHKNGVKLGPEQFFPHSANTTYEIKNVSKNDQGIYIIRAMNEIGRSYKTLKVTVKGGIPVVVAGSSTGHGIVRAGDEVTMGCIVSSDLPYTVTWLKLANPNANDLAVGDIKFPSLADYKEERIGVFENNSLFFSYTELEDSGIYLCKAETSVGVGKSRFHLTVHEDPKVEIFVKSNDVVVGEQVTLTCKAISGNPKFAWTRNGTLMHANNPRWKIVEGNNQSELILSGIQKSDEGVYKCEAENEVGNDEVETTVQVYEVPKIIVDKERKVVVDGPTEVVLKCHAYNVPSDYELVWVPGQIPDETNLTQIFYEQNSSPKYNSSIKGYLTIKNVDRSDQGWYTCLAKSKGGISKDETFLKVEEVPKLTVIPNLIQFKEGEDIYVQCFLDAGLPVPNIMWFKDGRALTAQYYHIKIERSNDTLLKLQIGNAQLKDAGRYECRAINDVGFSQAFSDVHLIKTPTAVALEKSSLVKEGDPATLTCLISGKPHPDVKWYKDSQEILQNSIEQPEYVMNQNSLQLASVDKSSAGIYKCKAENSFGLAEDFIKLEVGSNPIINGISNSTDIDIETDGFLYCNVVGYPEPKVTWFRKDYRPLDSERFIKTETGELHIANARKEDEGFYTCVGENIYGSVTSEVEVKITGIVQPLLKKTQEQEENTKEIKKFLLGERVEMPCVILHGRPYPEKKWYFNGHHLQVTNQTNSVLSMSDDGTLVLNSLLPNQTGIYECTASNLAGVDRIRIELELFRQPLILGDTPNEVRGLLGQNVEIPCIAIGDPAPVLSWERPGYHQLPLGSYISDKQMEPTGSEDENLSITKKTYGGLVLVNVTLEDEGTYVCIAGNVAGTARRARSLQVLVPPKITSLSEDVSVIEGQVVELFCEVDGRPTPSVTWLKDNTPLKFHHAFNSKSIRFSSSAIDEGKYTCLASSSVGSDMKNTTVSVLVPPTIKNGGEERVEVVEGDSTEIQCSASGVPKPTISWQWKGLQNSSDSIEDDHFTENEDKLKIKNVTRELAGLYICDAENLAGITQKVFRLDVLVPPRILEDFPVNVSLAEGDDFSMPCTASGQPNPAIFWQRGAVLLRSGHQDGNKFVMQDNTLVLTAVTLESSGTYSCMASNTAGSASRNYSIEVYVAPVVVDSSETRVEVMETMTGKLTCPVAAASIMWLKNGTAVDFKANERADDVHFKTADEGRSLEIVEASSVDSGVYTCVATNPAGTSQFKFMVDVIVSPFFHNEYAVTNIKVQQGEPVLLNCSVGGNPRPKMSWRRLEGNLPVTEHTVLGVVFDKTKESIRIPAAEYHHAGKYHCSAFNKLDRIDRTFKITVSGPPEIDGKSEESIEIINGETQTLTCSITGVPEPEFSWIFTTRRHNNVTLKEASNQLVLANFTLDDSGVYYCKATNMAGVKFKMFNVSIIEPPTIESSEFRETIRVRSNEALKLSCITRGVPQPSVAWLRNGHILKAGSNMQSVNNTHTVTLPALGGKYSCVASNKAGMTEKHFMVKILVAPRWAKQVEKLTSDDALTPVVGFPLHIKCPVTGSPPPDISWLKDGQPLPAAEGDSVYYAEAEVAHSGNYTCYAVNNAGNFTKTFKVDVLVPPRFLDGTETRRLKLEPNMTAILNCSSEGNPIPKVMWLRGLTPITPQNTSQEILELQSVSGADSGDYLCISSNLAGELEKSFTVEVLEAPGVDSLSALSVPNLLVKLHHRVTIRCPLTGSPSPNITWFKDGEKLSRESDNNFEISPDEREVQIMHAVTSDAGVYQCVAQNQAGLKELSFELSVVVPLEWGDWSQWEVCSASCGGGEQRRERVCGQGKNLDLLSQMNLVNLDKSSCLGDAIQIRKCNQFPCLTEGSWSEWSSWSDCSASCGQSFSKRSRVCDTQETDMPCSGPDSEFKTCQVPSCSFWGSWSDWSECSASCNHGTKSRRRMCVGMPGSCDGKDEETTTCNTHRCPVNGKWSSWGEWGECSVTCGRGVRQRARICYRPRNGGKPCAGDNLQIEKCRLRGCHNKASAPKLANLRVNGRLNGEELEETNLVAKVGHYRGKRVVTATVDDILKQQAGWFPYLTFLMPPVQWNTAYEEGSADNGYSLTNGNFDQESRYQFATGHELVIDAKGRGIDPDNGTLQVDIEVIGNIPMAQPKASVVIEPFTEDFVQTGPNRLFSSSESTVDVDGKQIPFYWNKTVFYDTELGTMPYPVERLATDEILSDYDADSQRLFYSASNSISSPYGRDKCPKGFKLDQRYQHCRDIDECKSKRTNDCHHTQTCENLFGTYRCICAEGFKLTANGKRCQDINECEEGLHECSHTCINTIGGYRCACPLGMILHQDTLTCKEDSYNYDSDFASDWGNDDSYNTQHNRRNLNYDEYDSLLALNQVREEWLCPPGQIQEDNRCIEEKGKGKEHCSLEKCGEHETCLPTVSGYRCVETRCPLLYQHDIQTRKCFAVCTESRCEKGAKEWEEITFVPLPLESASVQQYQDLLELSTEDESSNMIYTVAENEFNLPLRVRIENNAGILYSMRYFDFEGVNKVVIQATTYEDHTSTALSIYTFVVFVYDPSSI